MVEDVDTIEQALAQLITARTAVEKVAFVPVAYRKQFQDELRRLNTFCSKAILRQEPSRNDDD